MRHINFDCLVRINSIQAMRYFPKITKLINVVCKECRIGKQARIFFKVKEQSSTDPLELVHIDLCRPTRIQIFQGDMYFMLLIDDYSRMN